MGSFFDDLKLGAQYLQYMESKNYFALCLTIATDVRSMEPDQIRSLLRMLEGAEDQEHAREVREIIIEQARMAGR